MLPIQVETPPMTDPLDERTLPAMYTVWPTNRLQSPPIRALPSDYAIAACAEDDLPSVRRLIDADEPIPEQAWSWLCDRILPAGAIGITHRPSGRLVATACAVHNPRATRHYFPFGGEVGYVTVDPAHRRRGLGHAVVARVLTRFLEAGYRTIFVGVQGWRLPAIRCYFGLGFVPLLHDDTLLPRWQRICRTIGYRVDERDWPRRLDEVMG
jgi:mycothiol synthase